MPSFRRRFLSVIIWSMIAAAFIGPGTVTSAAAAGAGHDFQLLWALGFATFACIILQEASARISIVNGKELPKVINDRFGGRAGITIKVLIGGSVIFGCAAYQGGNIMGAISGIQLLTEIPKVPLVLLMSVLIAILLYVGTYQNLAKILSLLVGMMGLSFLFIAIKTDHQAVDFFMGFVPTIPSNSEWLVLGLVGTTIVPYNLFLGSGISKGQDLSEMRTGLLIAIIFGGLISMAILMTGTLIVGEFSFQSLAVAMQTGFGDWAVYLLAGGLFAAGFTSSVTSPLAAGFIARGFFSSADSISSFRVGWGTVLLIGLGIGLLDFKPIPIIIMAQALNGLILPAIAFFLMILVNDPRVLPEKNLNTVALNIVTTVVVMTVSGIGANNLLSAISEVISLPINKAWVVLPAAFGAGLLGWVKIYRIRFSQI